MEDIHQLRVTIKELRAFWMLIEWASAKSFKKDLHNTEMAPLFKSAGRLREAQVNYSLVQKYKQGYMQPYKDHLLELEETCIVHLLVIMEVFDMKKYQRLNKKMYKLIVNLEEGDIKKNIARLILHKLMKAENLRPSLPDDKKLHKIRIHLKVIKEMFQIMKELKLSRGLEKIRKHNITVCKHLGEWHDLVELSHSLSALNTDNFGGVSLSYYRRFIEKIEKKEYLKKELVLTKLESYLNNNQIESLKKIAQ